MSKRGENIYKRKDGRWEGRYVKCRTLHGKIQYGYVYGKSYSETKAKLKENASAPIRSSSSQATQSALYDEVLKAWLLSSKNRVKESTFSRYNHLVERHIQPLLGRYPISEISTVLLEECIDYLLQNGRLDGSGGLSPKSVSDIIVVMKSSIRYALGNGYPVNCSPAGLSVKRSKRICAYYRKRTATAGMYFNAGHGSYEVYCFALPLYRYPNRRSVRTQVGTPSTGHRYSGGQRNHAAYSSAAKHSNENKGDYYRTKKRMFKTGYSAASVSHTICGTVSDRSKGICFDWRKDQFIEPRTLQNRFRNYVEASGIEHANYHALRHTFATRCVELGFEIKSLSEILGHSNVNITLNKYVHSSIELKKQNMEKLNPAMIE